MSKHVDILIDLHNTYQDWKTEQRHAIGAPSQCRTCGHMGYTTAPERPCALCDTIMQSDTATLEYIGRMMRVHGYDPHTAAEELRQLATKGQ